MGNEICCVANDFKETSFQIGLEKTGFKSKGRIFCSTNKSNDKFINTTTSTYILNLKLIIRLILL